MGGADDLTGAARRLWLHLETVHALTYFAAESRAAFTAAGFRGFWRGYFAGRAAPLGPVGPGPVVASFYGFHPDMVRRAVPDVWDVVTPSAAIEARLAGVDAAIRNVAGDALGSEQVIEAAEALRGLADDAPSAGRPLCAANQDLTWPEDAHLVLWQAATVLREHRGDGHVALLVADDLDGCEAQVLMVATGRLGRSDLQPNRGWSDADWAAATVRLTDRGWLGEDGTATAAGIEDRRRIERETDALAAAAYRSVGAERCEHLVSLLAPLTTRVLTAGDVPTRNPMGAPLEESG